MRALLVSLLVLAAARAELTVTQLAGFGARRPAAAASGTLTYVSDGDANGVVYHIGTTYGTTGFSNPHTSGQVTVVMSSTIAGTPANLVDRVVNANVLTNDVPNSWIAIDLGTGRTLVPNRYSLRHRDQGSFGFALRSWKLQGSNDAVSNSVSDLAAATWTDLDVQVNNTTINAEGAWVSPVVSGVVTGYRWLRIVQTGPTSSGSDYLVCTEFEFYGEFAH